MRHFSLAIEPDYPPPLASRPLPERRARGSREESAAAREARASDEGEGGRPHPSPVPCLALPQERSDEDQERSDPRSAGGALSSARSRRDVSSSSQRLHLT